MEPFRFTFRGKNKCVGHAIVVAENREGAETRFKSSLWKLKERDSTFNAQLAWDTRELFGIPIIEDIGFCQILHDGSSVLYRSKEQRYAQLEEQMEARQKKRCERHGIYTTPRCPHCVQEKIEESGMP